MKISDKSITLAAVFLFSISLLCGCAEKLPAADSTPSPVSEEKSAASPAPTSVVPMATDTEVSEDYYHDYMETGGEVAVIITTSTVDDMGFNQAVYEGAQIYAQAAGVSYSYYSADAENEAEYLEAVTTAIENDAKLVLCAGSQFAPIIGELQEQYPDTHFLLIDSVPTDPSGKEIAISTNVHCITYHEEEAGYLAGYMTVLDGYTLLGFVGGEENGTVQRFGYGYLQGIEDAADHLGLTHEIEVNYWYCNSFSPSKEIEDMACKWYQSGTQVIFSCGGSIYKSVLDAADECDGLIIGVDVDQSEISKRVLTSAAKGVKNSVIIALDEYYANGNSWPEALAGQAVSYGTDKKCVELPTDEASWRFRQATEEDYWSIFEKVKKREIIVSNDISTLPALSIHVNYLNEENE